MPPSQRKPVFTDGALAAIARKAMARATGACGLRGTLDGLLRETMFELPWLEGVASCIVDEQTAGDGEPPRFVGADEAAYAEDGRAGSAG